MAVTMTRPVFALLLVPALFGLGACSSEPPRTTQVIVQPAPQQTPATVGLAPVAPPPARSELVPPPPEAAGPVVWQPGHWLYTGVTGSEWSWQPGHYMPAPRGVTTWVPGRWTQQPTGEWYWMDGHWA